MIVSSQKTGEKPDGFPKPKIKGLTEPRIIE